MRPSILKFGSAPIPFRSAFGHASATRASAENVVVYVEDSDGVFGLGEGCPRKYVTGETVETACAFLGRHRSAFVAFEEVEALGAWMGEHGADVDANPSAFCAVELAFLDLFSRQRGYSIERFLGIEPLQQSLSTSAVYGTGGWPKFEAQAFLFRLNGMRDAKLKISGDVPRDAARARKLARGGRLRLDANNLWQNADAAVAGLKRLARHAWAVEEPVRPRDWRAMSVVGEQTGLVIIVDESFTQLRDLGEMPIGRGFIPNFRVSKLGGLLRSLVALRRALEQGRKIIIGAQVGETSMLARAGIALAAAATDSLLGYEGAYGVRLLKWDLATPRIVFGPGGKTDLNSAGIGSVGLGLRPTDALFESLR